MIDPVLLAAPLLIAAVVLAVRFVGCAGIAGIEDPPPPIAKTKYSALVSDTANIVSFWRLNELPSGSSPGGPPASDSKGPNQGTYHGAVSQPAIDLLGGDDDGNTATGFDGGSAYVSVQFNTDLNPAAFTVEALVLPTSNVASKTMTIVSSLDLPSNTGYMLQISNSACVATVGDGTTLRPVVVDAQVQPDERYYVALTYDGKGKAELYVNPEAFDLVRGTHTFDPQAFKDGDTAHKSYMSLVSPNCYKPQTKSDLWIGADNLGAQPGNFFEGVIQNVAVYDAPVGFDDIVKHFWCFDTGYAVPHH